MNNYIMIDASYFVINTALSHLKKWKNKNKSKEIDIGDLHNNDLFISEYKELFKGKLFDLSKYINYDNKLTYIIGKDCPRNMIWRKQLYQDYKKNRDNLKSDFNISKIFEIVWKDNLFDFINDDNVDIHTLYHENLEADDCLAIATKYILKNCEDLNEILIITADTDYLQLITNKVRVMNLNYNLIQTEKNSLYDNEKDLLVKILMGDKSDNIPSVFKRCGWKTAVKYANNLKSILDKFKDKKNGSIYNEQYHLNHKLISFECIPKGFVKIIQNKLMMVDI